MNTGYKYGAVHARDVQYILLPASPDSAVDILRLGCMELRDRVMLLLLPVFNSFIVWRCICMPAPRPHHSL
jgi:hypothetical protein